jgi:HAE1 family hydrophobic/amphiphilic exporter-1
LTRSLDIASVDLPNRVSAVNGPHEVKTTPVIAKNARSCILPIGFYTRDNICTQRLISNYLDTYMKGALKRIHGVADVIPCGEREYSMRLWLDPSQMAARGLTTSDVVTALAQQNVQIAA